MLDYICYMPVNAKFLEEKGDDFGVATSETNLLYCGPYIISELKPQERRVYTKNESYWDKDNVFIDVIELMILQYVLYHISPKHTTPPGGLELYSFWWHNRI